ncbi:MAG TPA: hypothetical protein ENK06_05375 [Gammaproteobacteria bacterium]|nr:hypothetical protein [Gammaproteobacteria bacterium]
MESIQIHLAPNALFEEQGIEILPILRKFRFSVEDKKNGSLYIKVQTESPVKELSISFLLEVIWNGGRMIKNYDILLTPEAITQTRKERINKATSSKKQLIAKHKPAFDAPSRKKKHQKKKNRLQTATQSTASNSHARKSSPNKKIRQTKTGGYIYSPVSPGESLSLIANRIRSGKNMSTNQVMVALFNENREAFFNNDINRLQVGKTLKIKDRKSITNISKQKAIQLISQYIKGPASIQAQANLIADNGETKKADKTKAEAEITPPLPADTETNKRLVISSANEEPIPLDIMNKIKEEELAADKEEIKVANMKVVELQAENKTLKARIIELEKKRDEAIERLFLATVGQNSNKNSSASNSQTQQDRNLLVASTDLGLENQETPSLLDHIEKYRTAISLSSVAFLSMTLIGIRKKEKILDIVDELKSRFS